MYVGPTRRSRTMRGVRIGGSEQAPGDVTLHEGGSGTTRSALRARSARAIWAPSGTGVAVGRLALLTPVTPASAAVTTLEAALSGGDRPLPGLLDFSPLPAATVTRRSVPLYRWKVTRRDRAVTSGRQAGRQRSSDRGIASEPDSWRRIRGHGRGSGPGLGPSRERSLLEGVTCCCRSSTTSSAAR